MNETENSTNRKPNYDGIATNIEYMKRDIQEIKETLKEYAHDFVRKNEFADLKNQVTVQESRLEENRAKVNEITIKTGLIISAFVFGVELLTRFLLK